MKFKKIKSERSFESMNFSKLSTRELLQIRGGDGDRGGIKIPD
jgi:hypothetical protein